MSLFIIKINIFKKEGHYNCGDSRHNCGSTVTNVMETITVRTERDCAISTQYTFIVYSVVAQGISCEEIWRQLSAPAQVVLYFRDLTTD